MSDATKNPFARLDTALMRSTKQSQETERPNASTPERANNTTVERPLTRTSVDPNDHTTTTQEVRRAIKRGSFEFYIDQLEQIQRLALEEKIQGKKGSQSEMVREALDEYIKKRGVQK